MNQNQKWKPLNTKAILHNIKQVITTGNINKLNKQTYNFIMNLSGFIAHYNIEGFKGYYNNTNDLIKDLTKSTDTINPEYYITDFFIQKEEQKDYYISKAETLKQIKKLLQEVNRKWTKNNRK